jgi:hypothetical protein
MVVVVSLVRTFVQQLSAALYVQQKMHIDPYRWEMVKSNLRLQASTFSKPMFPFLNLGLAEKPVSFSSSLSPQQFLNNFQTQRADKTKVLTL